MTVLVAVDRSDDTKSIVEEGAALATQFDDDLEVVHVMTRADFVELERSSVSETEETVEIDEVREIAAGIAREAADGLGGDFVATGLVGDAASEVARLAKDRDARYVVVGIRKRSPVGKAVFGSVAQKIMLKSDRPVVAVPRPPAE